MTEILICGKTEMFTEDALENECFDYVSMDSGGKAYGVKAIIVNADGTISEYENVE